MEDALEKASNEHRTIYYASQLRVLDISQNIRAMGVKLTDNQIKIATTESYNNFCILQKIFQEAAIPHVYQLIKTINQNYNSVVAVLLEKNYKLTQSNSLKNAGSSQKHEEGEGGKQEDGITNPTTLLKVIKKNRLGGIHLFNENYARYLEDNRILDEIKAQKAKRLHRNRMEILRESIFEELNHKTDVEEYPAKNDEITNYILKTKDKNSIFNYISYEPELQEILVFFQNSQSEANQFLVKKGSKINDEDCKFSFSDFQRDIQYKNILFKKQIIQKFKEFIEKYRRKEEQLQTYLSSKEAIFQKLEQKYFKTQQQSIQTQLNLDELIKNYEGQVKDLELKYQALEKMKKEEMNSGENLGEIMHVLALRENHIEKLNNKIAELESAVEYVKKLLREEKAKKSISTKEEPWQKSQKTIPEIAEKEKSSEVTKEPNEAESNNEDPPNLNSSEQLRKTSYMSNSWRRKQSNDASSYLNFGEIEKEGRDHESFAKAEKRKYVRYNIESKFSEQDKNIETVSNSVKFKNFQSCQIYVQTEQRGEGYNHKEKKSAQKLYETTSSVLDEEDKVSKKSKISPLSTPKTSSKNFDLFISKNSSSQKLTETSKKLKERNNITSITKIKSEQDSQNQGQIVRKSNPKKKKTKKEDVKIDRLTFTNSMGQPIENEAKKELSNDNESQSVDAVVKNIQKKDQISYKIFEVVEEEGEEEKDTIKNTERSEQMSSVYSHKKLESELIEKLNSELNKIKQERSCNYQHLYNLTIFPSKQSKSGSYWNGDQSETSQPRSIEVISPALPKDYPKSISIFDNLIKSQPHNQIKREKLKNWKKKIMTNLKSQTINEKEAQQIIAVIQESTKCQQLTQMHEELVSPISSIASNIRNSLPEINENENRPIKKPGAATGSCFRKSKLKTSCEENAENIIKIEEKITIIPEFQQKIDELIRYESLQPDFKEKFLVLHKKCQEGEVCSHVNKYFQTIMKLYEEKKKKNKQSIALPIEHIGNRTELQELIEKQSKPKNAEIVKSSKDNTAGQSKGKLAGLTRQRYSQQFILPTIKESKLNMQSIKGSKIAT